MKKAILHLEISPRKLARSSNKGVKMEFIQVNNLSKIYLQKDKKEERKIQALDNLSFNISKGEIIGYVGVNGAGKSTTIKILAGILKPTEGEVIVGGVVPYKKRKQYVKNIGVMFGQRSQLEWDLPAIDTYKMLKQIYRIPDKEYHEMFEMLHSLLQLEGIENTPVRQLSLGQKTKCELIATFLHNPALVFLDEPTIGLDLQVKEQIHYFIKEVNRKFNTTIFITSHDVGDIEEVVQRIMVINEGKIYFDGKISDLIRFEKFKTKIRIELKNGAKFIAGNLTNYKSLDESQYEISVENSESIATVVNQIVLHNDIIDISIQKIGLEDVLLNIYKNFRKNQ